MKKILLLLLSIYIFSFESSPVVKYSINTSYDKYSFQNSYKNAQNNSYSSQNLGISFNSGMKMSSLGIPFGTYLQLLAGADVNVRFNFLGDDITYLAHHIYKQGIDTFTNISNSSHVLVDFNTNNQNINKVIYSDLNLPKYVLTATSNIYAKLEMAMKPIRKMKLHIFVANAFGVNISLCPDFLIYQKIKAEILKNKTFDPSLSEDQKEMALDRLLYDLENNFYANYKDSETKFFYEFSAGLKYNHFVAEIFSGYNSAKIGLKLSYERQY